MGPRRRVDQRRTAHKTAEPTRSTGAKHSSPLLRGRQPCLSKISSRKTWSPTTASTTSLCSSRSSATVEGTPSSSSTASPATSDTHAAGVVLNWIWPKPIPPEFTGAERQKIATQIAQWYASFGFAVPMVIQRDLPENALCPERDVLRRVRSDLHGSGPRALRALHGQPRRWVHVQEPWGRRVGDLPPVARCDSLRSSSHSHPEAQGAASLRLRLDRPGPLHRLLLEPCEPPARRGGPPGRTLRRTHRK